MTTVPTNADLIALGQAVRHLRQERRLTIEALAFRSGMHPTYLSSIERGLRNPTLVKLSGLAGGLDISLAVLANEAEAQAQLAERMREVRAEMGML